MPSILDICNVSYVSIPTLYLHKSRRTIVPPISMLNVSEIVTIAFKFFN